MENRMSQSTKPHLRRIEGVWCCTTSRQAVYGLTGWGMTPEEAADALQVVKSRAQRRHQTHGTVICDPPGQSIRPILSVFRGLFA
jgi:hypothetical protein